MLKTLTATIARTATLLAGAAIVLTIALVGSWAPPAPVLDAAPALNSAGDHVYASAQVSDGTGVVTTVAAAGTYVTVGTAAPLAAGETDGSGCITYTLASNKFTIAKPCGAGEIKLTACLNDVAGVNSATWTGAWHRVRSAVTTQQGPILRETEGGSAARDSEGCVTFIHAASNGDTYDFRYDSGTNADTVTTRQATFMVEKLLN